MTSDQTLPTVGILYPGELGAALADVFMRNGSRVVSTVRGRSERTRSIAAAADIELLDGLQQVVETADILVSTVTPKATLTVAQEIIQYQPAPGTILVDANSIAPRTAKQIASACAAADIEFVDMAVRGLASRLVERGAVYLSGTRASCIASLLSPVEIEMVGQEAGAASQLKMIMSGMSKGVAAQFIELSLAAHSAGILDRFLLGVQRYYPDVYAAMQSVLPTYPQHIGRRAQELAEVVSCMNDLNLTSEVVAGGKRLFERIADTELHQSANALREAPMIDVVEAMAQHAPLHSENALTPQDRTVRHRHLDLHLNLHTP